VAAAELVHAGPVGQGDRAVELLILECRGQEEEEGRKKEESKKEKSLCPGLSSFFFLLPSCFAHGYAGAAIHGAASIEHPLRRRTIDS
jgi:hypothetical protein